MSRDAADTLLERLQARGIIDAGRRDALVERTGTPWWLAALLALAAWIAALIILSAFFGPLLMLVDSALARAVGGGVLIAAALYLFRRATPFAAQMALAFSLAGQALIVTAVAGDAVSATETRTLALTAMIVAAAMMWPAAPGLHRTVCALIVLLSLAWLIGPGRGLALFGVVLTAAAAALWLGRARWAAHPQAPIFKALAHAATLTALCLAPYGHANSALAAVDAVAGAGRYGGVTPVYVLGAAAVLLATVAWLTRAAPIGLRAAALAAAVPYAVAAHRTPGLLVSAALLLAVFHACHRPWVVLTLAFAALYLAELYYSLHATLLVKSLALAATGALLLLAWAGLRRWMRSAP